VVVLPPFVEVLVPELPDALPLLLPVCALDAVADVDVLNCQVPFTHVHATPGARPVHEDVAVVCGDAAATRTDREDVLNAIGARSTTVMSGVRGRACAVQYPPAHPRATSTANHRASMR
jgi:hypothetical protein